VSPGRRRFETRRGGLESQAHLNCRRSVPCSCPSPQADAGRALPAVVVGDLDALLECQLSGGEVNGVTVSGRPKSVAADAIRRRRSIE